MCSALGTRHPAPPASVGDTASRYESPDCTLGLTGQEKQRKSQVSLVVLTSYISKLRTQALLC